MSVINTIYLHRLPGTIDAVLTVQEYDPAHPDIEPLKLFDRLPFRTGQYRLRNTDGWVQSSSIPKGDWWLWPRKEQQPKQYGPKGSGIGAFFPISSGKDNHRLIINPAKPHDRPRGDVGMHWENDFVGSLGCPVGLWNTKPRYAELAELFDWVREEGKVTEWIPFRVI